jgi:hypothetical protein
MALNFSKLVFRSGFCCFSIGLLILVAGCARKPRSVEHIEVTGKVLFQGKPLPGGLVTFVAVNGGFAETGTIDENGNYQVQAPVGDVEIGVTNLMLKGVGGPKGAPRLQKAEGAGLLPKKGRYVLIPPVYQDPHTSGLRYTVTPGTQTHDIELSANPTAPSAAPGS